METSQEVKISVVMPCLNEEKTIASCIQKARKGLEKMGVPAEIVISDNGSTDRSVEISESLGARVVHQSLKGYGYAYLKGIDEALGKYIVIGDSDDTYDFEELERFVRPLQDGYDMVMGNRFKGKILPGAMPWSHQYIGNPILSGILNLFFRTGIGDAHCGIRAFTQDAYKKMHLKTSGMEFASEMVINASKANLKITEVPITYYPRREGSISKLNSVRDGWRHLRFMLMYSPTWLFMIPGLFLLVLGLLLLFGLAFGPVTIGGLFFDYHFQILGSLLALTGFQVITIGGFAKVYAMTEDFDEPNRTIQFLLKYFDLERGLALGFVVFLIGLAINGVILGIWLTQGFNGQPRLREAIVALTLMVIGIQTIFSSFFLSMLGIKKTHGR